MDPKCWGVYDLAVPTPGNGTTEDDTAGEPVTEPVAMTGEAMAAGPAEDEEEDPLPPAIIVGLRAPDRAVSRTIGAPTPAHVGPGASISFGLSVSARYAEREDLRGSAPLRGRSNVLSLPHPRLEPRPTPVETTVIFDDDADG